MLVGFWLSISDVIVTSKLLRKVPVKKESSLSVDGTKIMFEKLFSEMCVLENTAQCVGDENTLDCTKMTKKKPRIIWSRLADY